MFCSFAYILANSPRGHPNANQVPGNTQGTQGISVYSNSQLFVCMGQIFEWKDI